MTDDDRPNEEHGNTHGRRVTALFRAVDPAASDDLVYRDELTGLYNRRVLTRLFEQGWEVFSAGQKTLALLVIDLNLFKLVNDNYGHLTGDEVLKVTSRLLAEHFRKEDLLVRFGGDEFVVVAPGVDAAAARELAARAGEALSNHTFTCQKDARMVDVPVSFSVGVASWPGDGASGEELLAVADLRLYEDKERRRPQRRKNLRRHVLLALLVTSTALAVWIRWPQQESPDAGMPPSTAAPAGVAAPSQELLRKILELEGVVAGLNEELATRKSAEERRETEGRVRRFEGELSQLRRQAAATAGLAPAPPAAASPSERPVVESPAPPRSIERVPVPGLAAERGSSTSVPRAPTGAILRELKAPKYPRIAKILGREAAVTVEIEIGSDGRVTEARVVGKPIGYGFEELALDAAKKSLWHPATLDGQAVPSASSVTVRFRPE